MENPQNDTKLTKQIRIESELHRLLKIKASEERISIKTLLERYVWEVLNEK